MPLIFDTTNLLVFYSDDDDDDKKNNNSSGDIKSSISSAKRSVVSLAPLTRQLKSASGNFVLEFPHATTLGPTQNEPCLVRGDGSFCRDDVDCRSLTIGNCTFLNGIRFPAEQGRGFLTQAKDGQTVWKE